MSEVRADSSAFSNMPGSRGLRSPAPRTYGVLPTCLFLEDAQSRHDVVDTMVA